MKVYVFNYHVEPTKGSFEHGKVGGAYVDIWVHESSREVAETKAISYLMDRAWQIIKVESELTMNDEQILDCREDAQANYRQAKKQGLSAFFSAYPPTDREDRIVEIFSIKKPPNSSGTEH